MIFNSRIPFSPPDRKLVTIDNFSEVVNLFNMADFLVDHGSKESSSRPSLLFLLSLGTGSHY